MTDDKNVEIIVAFDAVEGVAEASVVLPGERCNGLNAHEGERRLVDLLARSNHEHAIIGFTTVTGTKLFVPRWGIKYISIDDDDTRAAQTEHRAKMEDEQQRTAALEFNEDALAAHDRVMDLVKQKLQENSRPLHTVELPADTEPDDDPEAPTGDGAEEIASSFDGDLTGFKWGGDHGRNG